MKTDEIIQLSHEAVVRLLDSRRGTTPDKSPGHERRRSPRWPFPGTVEVCSPGDTVGEQLFGSLRNLSDTGLGMSCDRYIEPESRVDIAVHLPEVSLCGKAIVRYCMETPRGFMTGIEFDFAT